jgi:Zn-dependent protease with chaperone function
MEQEFSGGVFSETLEHGRAGAEIELLSSGVCACTSDGEPFVIPYRECQVEVGGNSGRMVFCRNEDRSITIFCEDRAFPRALSRVSAGVLDRQLEAALKKSRDQSRRGSLIVSAILAGILLLGVGVYFGVRAGAQAAVAALPVSVDQKLGETVIKTMDLEGPEINDPLISGAMQSIVDRMASEAAIDGMEFEVRVVDSPVVNAFCLPGGKMVVFSGLIRAAKNPEQLAAVLAHEMSHATLRHGLQQISQTMGMATALTLLVGDAEGLIATGEELFRTASINGYSRDQESAADREGVRMLHAAGINPREMSRFFEVLREEQGDTPGVLAWLSTHPDHASRIAAVNTMIDALPQREYQPLEVDWQAIQRNLKKDDISDSGDH